ncbi:MAG: hypothetical protein K1X53_09255 [Candidatus Sumerlaeaceae bacterium]|nr:hypothetical protein [Candidatus Sumerlaeaceae bacterium]
MTPPAAEPDSKHVYLAGAIEYAPDGGKGWRKRVEAFITTHLGLRVFNPCINEVAILTPEENQHFRRWKSEDRPRFLNPIRRIIDHDLDQVLNLTHFIVCYWDEHAIRGAGTAGELTLAYRFGIPSYVVLGMPAAQVSSWTLGCATEVFGSFDELEAFLLKSAWAGNATTP